MFAVRTLISMDKWLLVSFGKDMGRGNQGWKGAGCERPRVETLVASKRFLLLILSTTSSRETMGISMELNILASLVLATDRERQWSDSSG